MKNFSRFTPQGQGMAATVKEGTAPKQVAGNCAKHKRNSLFNV